MARRTPYVLTVLIAGLLVATVAGRAAAPPTAAALRQPPGCGRPVLEVRQAVRDQQGQPLRDPAGAIVWEPATAAGSDGQPHQLTGAYFRPDVRVTVSLGVIQVEAALTDEGGRLLEQITARNIGLPLALFVDGRLISAPVVHTVVGSSIVIAGLDEQEARRLADQITDAVRAEAACASAVGGPGRLVYIRDGALWVVNADGSGQTPLLDGPFPYTATDGQGDTNPHLSHRGALVAMVVGDALVVIELDTGRRTDVFTDAPLPRPDACPHDVLITDWDPTDKRLLFAVRPSSFAACPPRDDVQEGFYVADLTTGTPTALPALTNAIGWLDERRVVFEAGRTWETLDIESGAVERLADPSPGCFASQLSLAPYAGAIAYRCQGSDRSAIVVATADNTRQRTLVTGGPAELQFPRLSPDGGAVVYQRLGLAASGRRITEFVRYDLVSGEQLSLLTGGFALFGGWVDGNHVALWDCSSGLGSAARVVVVDTRTGGQTVLVEDAECR